MNHSSIVWGGGAGCWISKMDYNQLDLQQK